MGLVSISEAADDLDGDEDHRHPLLGFWLVADFLTQLEQLRTDLVRLHGSFLDVGQNLLHEEY